MGCDGDSKKEHEIPLKSGVFRTRQCPRKQMRQVVQYFQAYRWWEKGQLEFLYPPPRGVPAVVADGIEFISSMVAQIQDEKCPKK